MNVLKEHNK